MGSQGARLTARSEAIRGGLPSREAVRPRAWAHEAIAGRNQPAQRNRHTGHGHQYQQQGQQSECRKDAQPDARQPIGRGIIRFCHQASDLIGQTDLFGSNYPCCHHARPSPSHCRSWNRNLLGIGSEFLFGTLQTDLAGQVRWGQASHTTLSFSKQRASLSPDQSSDLVWRPTHSAVATP
jgi:hypothetical protein